MSAICHPSPAATAPLGRVACSPKEYAAATGVCIATVGNWIRAGHIQSYKIGGRRLIPLTELSRTERAA